MRAELEKGLAAQRTITDAVKAYSAYTGEKMAQTRQSALTLQMVVAAVGVLVGFLISFFIARNGIVSPLRAIIDAMHRLAQGDLTVQMGCKPGSDEIGRIIEAVVSGPATPP